MENRIRYITREKAGAEYSVDWFISVRDGKERHMEKRGDF